MRKSFVAKALALVPALCFSVAFGGPVGGSTSTGSSGDAIAGYVFGEENAKNAEDLAEAVVNKLADSRKYSKPRRNSREFFREVEKLERRAEHRGKLPDDRDFCRIGGEFGVNYLCIIDIEKAGRGNSVWGRIIDLSNCQVVGTAEYTGLIRNAGEIEKAANELSRELQNRRMNKRSIANAIASALAPASPPPPPPRGDAIAGYVFGEENAKNAEDLAEAVVNGLANSRKYSKPKRNSREFFREVEKLERKAEHRGKLPEDRDFCRIGNDFGVEYLCIIDIEKAGRGNSIWARVLDLDKCTIIATGEYTGLLRNPGEINKASDELVRELLNRRIGKRSIR